MQAWAAIMLCSFPAAGEAQPSTQLLKRMSLEELMSIEVSTVSRSSEPTATLPAAVFVITHEDIRRSGATTLPEALRLAPGIQVARIDASRYAIGLRGFPDRLARSMLVLMDGRAVYSPLFAGTYWEVQDTLLEDVDRIEVIRGPGGTLWGANAVNGIINIITRSAADSQGPLVSGAIGSDVRGPVAARYGWRAGAGGHARVYVKAVDRESQATSDMLDFDSWQMVQTGFRGDWAQAGARRLTVQGDAYAVALGQQFNELTGTPPYSRRLERTAPLSGANVLARWSGPLSGGGRFQLQTYFDRTSRDERPVAEVRHTFDVDGQLQRRLWAHHDVVTGLGYRVTSGAITAVAPTVFSPPRRTDNLYSFFIQDDVTLIPDRLRLVGGTKVEHNAYSGLAVQPSVRVAWLLDSRNTVVSSVTRAQRIPSRVETDYTTASVSNPVLPSFVRLVPNPDFRPEILLAYEMGYRLRGGAASFFTVSGFYNDLDNILSTELLTPVVEDAPPPRRVVLPVIFANGLDGNSHGIEVTADLRPSSGWRVTTNYSFLRVRLSRQPGSGDLSQERRNEGLSPQHQVQIQSSIDLPRALSFDWFFRYSSELESGPVPAYATSNARIAWRGRKGIELALVGQNLHAPRHVEWASGASTIAVRRSAYVSVTWRPQPN